MPVRSAGILLYRQATASPHGPAGALAEAGTLEVWIAHMGGPFWARKDERAWSIPKGEYADDEDPLAAALREFAEEMGTPAPAAEAAFNPEAIRSNTFPLEWPKGSGRIQDFPEIDDAGWFPEQEARLKLVKGQLPVLDALADDRP